jgi:hypothetical protein
MTPTPHEQMKAFISDPIRWPKWPVLPMKREGEHGTEAGFCVTADYPTIVLKQFPTPRGILYQLACEDGLPMLGQDRLRYSTPDERKVYDEQMVEHRYDDIDQMLDAGWVID